MMHLLPLLFCLFACGPRVRVASPGPLWELNIEPQALPGGSLRVLHTATVGMKDAQAFAGGGKDERRGPVSAMLFVHPMHGAVLIDAGFGRATQTEPPQYPSKFTRNLLDIQMITPVVDALPQVGLRASDVRQVFLTHLHHDHSGGLADLPAAIVRADAGEWAAAQKQRPLSGYEPEPYLQHRFVPILFDGPAVGPIPRSHDVFRDGSLIALPASGHTVGHTMYLVNLPTGAWLFTGDAAWVDANWSGDEPLPKGWLARNLIENDWKQGLDALRAIQWFAEHGVTVVSGHEPKNVERFTWPNEL